MNATYDPVAAIKRAIQRNLKPTTPKEAK